MSVLQCTDMFFIFMTYAFGEFVGRKKASKDIFERGSNDERMF